MHNCRKSDAEITFKTSSTRNRVLWDFWQRVKERGRNYKMLYCAPNLLWCPAPCAAPARVQLWPWASPCKYSLCLEFRPCSQHCLLFIVQPQHSRISTPWPDPPWQWARCCWSRPTGSPSSGCSPCWRPLTSVLCWGVGEVRTASSGQNPTCKSAQTLVFMQQDMYLD